MGVLILGAILQFMVSAYFSCFLWSVKGYIAVKFKAVPVWSRPGDEAGCKLQEANFVVCNSTNCF